MAKPVVPPGQSAPAAIVNPTHHGAWLIITTAFGLLLVLICLSIRLYAKLTMRTLAGGTDLFLVGAAIAALVQSILVFTADGKGLGNSVTVIPTHALDTLQKLVYASDFFYLVTLYLSKCCVVFIYLEITPNRWHNRAAWGAFGLSSLWLCVGILMLSISCALEQPWIDIANQCHNMHLRWALIAAFDCVTEVFLFLLSVFVVLGLQTPLKRKATVVLTFGARLPIVAFALIRLHYLKTYIHSSDPSLDGVSTFIWTEVETMYSVIACTVYWLKPFMSAVSTHYGATAIDVTGFEATKGRSAGFGYGNGSVVKSKTRSQNDKWTPSNSLGLSRIRKTPNTSEIQTIADEEEIQPQRPQKQEIFRPDRVDYKARVRSETGKHDAESVESNNSTRMIIKKQVDYRVDYEGQRSRQEEERSASSYQE